jgi:hypothetical protein
LCYHLTPASRVDTILRYGLFSTSALLDRAGLTGRVRERLERRRRAAAEVIIDPEMGPITLRDQKPMSDTALARALAGRMPVDDWYATLNRRVFFWVESARVQRLAAAYPDEEHVVLVLGTRQLLAIHHQCVALSPINSGSTIMVPAPRGPDTFLPLKEYPLSEWARRRKRWKSAVAELTVEYAVRDIRDHVLDIRPAAELG